MQEKEVNIPTMNNESGRIKEQQPFQNEVVASAISVHTTHIPTSVYSHNDEISELPDIDNNSLYWNRSSFYMNTGRLYSSIDKLSMNRVFKRISPLKSDLVYPVLTMDITDEKEWSNYEYTFNDEWKLRFQSLQDEVYQQYQAVY